MPSPRNYIFVFVFLIWQRHFLGMASLRNVSFLFLKLKIENSAAAAAGILFLVTTITYLLPKIKFRFLLASCLHIFTIAYT